MPGAGIGSGGSGTISAGGVGTTELADAAVTLAKMANLAQDTFIGRTTASTGVPEVATITAAARSVLDDTTVGAMVDTLGGASSTGTGGLARSTAPVLTGAKFAGANASNYLTLAYQEETISVGTGVTTADGTTNWIPAGMFVVGVRSEVLVQPGNTTTMGIGTTVTAQALLVSGSASTAGALTGGGPASASFIGCYGIARTVRITFNATTNDTAGRVKIGIWYLQPTVA